MPKSEGHDRNSDKNNTSFCAYVASFRICQCLSMFVCVLICFSVDLLVRLSVILFVSPVVLCLCVVSVYPFVRLFVLALLHANV